MSGWTECDEEAYEPLSVNSGEQAGDSLSEGSLCLRLA